MQRPFASPQTDKYRRQCGFSLMEVLVALLVLSIGLLGLAALQTTGLRFNTQSYQRTQAVLNAYDIIDRIRANPGGMNAGTYDNIDLAANTSAVDCTEGNGDCTPAQMADYDIGEWKASVASLISQGQGAICRGTLVLLPSYSCTVDVSATVFVVGLTWAENARTMSLMMEAEL